MSLLADMFRAKVASMDYNMKNEATDEVGYPTGFLNFDFTNGFIAEELDPSTAKVNQYFNLGITDGTFVTFIGNTGTGKTTFVCQIAANIARQFKTATIFEDSVEGGLTFTRRLSLSLFTAEEYKKRYIIRNTGITAENFYKRIKMIHDMKIQNKDKFIYDTGHKDMYGNPIMKLEPTIYILDSIAMIMPEKYAEEDELSGNSAAAASARVITQIFRTIIPMLKAANIILIGINHILEDVSMNAMPKKVSVPYLKQGERMPKGRTVTFLANNIIRIENVAKLTADKEYKIEGSVVEISILKSRTSGKKGGTRVIYDFDNGFDPWLSLLRFMKDNNLLYGAGVSLSVDPEKKYKFSQGNFRGKINNDPEFRKFFMDTVLHYLKQIPTKRDVVAEDSDVDELLNNQDIFKLE